MAIVARAGLDNESTEEDSNMGQTTKRTPGPWEARTEGRDIVIDAPREGVEVARLFLGAENDHEAQTACRADARMIAAAPALFASLRWAMSALPEPCSPDCARSLYAEEYAAARAALALVNDAK